MVKLDPAGYFVILTLPVANSIHVEHYSYENVLLRELVGQSARDIYLKLISDGWVTELTHAAYLGKELARAEDCLQHGRQYVQEGA